MNGVSNLSARTRSGKIDGKIGWPGNELSPQRRAPQSFHLSDLSTHLDPCGTERAHGQHNPFMAEAQP
jgi:hypothetical protein